MVAKFIIALALPLIACAPKVAPHEAMFFPYPSPHNSFTDVPTIWDYEPHDAFMGDLLTAIQEVANGRAIGHFGPDTVNANAFTRAPGINDPICRVTLDADAWTEMDSAQRSWLLNHENAACHGWTHR